MAKQTTVKIKLESTAGTGYYYVTKKNSRTKTEKMVIMITIFSVLVREFFLVT